MPMKRKTMKPRRKRVVRKRAVPVRRMGLQLYRLVRTAYFESWSPNPTTTNGFWRYYAINLDLMPSSTEYATIFDRYKINALKFTFRPRFDNFAGNDTTDTTLPGITNNGQTHAHIIVDPYTAAVPVGTYGAAALNGFLENGRVKSFAANKPFSVYFKPSINQLTDTTSVLRRMKAPWLSLGTQRNVNHFGFHIFLNDVGFTGNFAQTYDIHVTYYLMFKGDR